MDNIHTMRIVEVNIKEDLSKLVPLNIYESKKILRTEEYKQNRLNIIKYLRQKISRKNRVWIPKKDLKGLIRECRDRHYGNKDLLNELDEVADDNDPCWVLDYILTEILNFIEGGE